ncbi:MAG: hypothetical protein KGI58_00005, partial [Patescibacteria group bacterium]|nr:hypothetical protein [Patescibacteria group bacterium]
MKTNNTKKFTSTLVALIIALGIVSAINYVSAYSAPTFTFPNCPTTTDGCNTPINVGSTTQTKSGNLNVAGTTNQLSNLGFITTSILATSNSEFQQGVTVDQLKNSVDHTVCVDPNGKLVLCNAPGSVTVSASYNQSLAVSGIAGYTQSPTPLISGNTTTGTHSAFTGSITVTVGGSSIAPGAQVGLSVNGSQVSCYNAASPKTITFSSRSYALSDSILVDS